MHPTVKELRSIVSDIDGVWVRRWRNGDLSVGIDVRRGFTCDLDEIRHRITASGKYRTTVRDTRDSWCVEAL